MFLRFGYFHVVSWFPCPLVGSSLRSEAKVVIKNIQIKATRKNTAKMLQHQDTSNLKEGRSVVNIALEKYSKRVKINFQTNFLLLAFF